MPTDPRPVRRRVRCCWCGRLVKWWHGTSGWTGLFVCDACRRHTEEIFDAD